MQIRVNGEPFEAGAATNVQALLDQLSLDRERVAVELNRRILKRGEFADTPVEHGDELEVVTFVGGG